MRRKSVITRKTIPWSVRVDDHDRIIDALIRLVQNEYGLTIRKDRKFIAGLKQERMTRRVAHSRLFKK